MNIKIVFKDKTHKISQQHKTFVDIKNAILKLYPEQLKDGMKLYFSLTPTQEPIELFGEEQFNRIKEIYQQLQQSSIKFLVKDILNPELTPQDLYTLNQSVVIKPEIESKIEAYRQELQPQLQKVVQQEIPQELQQIQDIPQQPVIQQNQEQQNQEDQQQIIQQDQPKQQQQELKQDFAQEIIKQINEKNQFDIDFTTPEFKQFIIDQIDERLKFHGLVQQQQHTLQQQLQKKPTYKMSLLMKQHNQIVMQLGQPYQWITDVKNEGTEIWKVGVVKLVGISGVFNSLQIELQNDVKPQGIAKFIAILPPQQKGIKDSTQEFKLAYLENNQLIYFGQKICFVLNVQNQVRFQQPGIIQKDPQFQVNISDQNMKKIKEFKDFTQASHQDAMAFFQAVGFQVQLDEAVSMYLDQFAQK